MSFEENHKNKHFGHKIRKNNPWFLATLSLCVTVLILSAVVFYVIRPKPGGVMLDKFFQKNGKVEHLNMICVDEDLTLKQIAADTELSYERLYNILDIEPGTDPDTKLSELFDEYEGLEDFED